MRTAADQHTHHPGTDAHPDCGSERTSRAGAVAHLGPARTDVGTGSDIRDASGAQRYTAVASRVEPCPDAE